MDDCGCQGEDRSITEKMGSSWKSSKKTLPWLWSSFRKMRFLVMQMTWAAKAMGSSAHRQQMTTWSSELPGDMHKKAKWNFFLFFHFFNKVQQHKRVSPRIARSKNTKTVEFHQIWRIFFGIIKIQNIKSTQNYFRRLLKVAYKNKQSFFRDKEQSSTIIGFKGDRP